MDRSNILPLSATQRAILDMLRNHEGASRAELSVRTGLTPGALSRQIKDLLTLSLVEEGVRRSGGRGQPPLPISLRGDAAYSIGLAFSLHEIEAVGINFRGEIVAQLARPLRHADAGGLIAQCSALVRELEESLPQAGRPILGIGIAMPGYFRPGRPIKVETFDVLVELAGVDLNVFLSAFGRPTWVENNSSAAALAEYYSRADRAVRNLILVNIGYGFSAGFITDGKLYRGRHGNAGEVGRLYPRGTPRPSALDLVSGLSGHGIAIHSRAEIEATILEDPAPVREWIARAGEQLRQVVSLLDHVLAPDEIVLGGQIPSALAQRLGEVVGAPTDERHKPPFRTSSLGPQASALGAAFLPIYQTLAPRLENSDEAKRKPAL